MVICKLYLAKKIYFSDSPKINNFILDQPAFCQYCDTVFYDSSLKKEHVLEKHRFNKSIRQVILRSPTKDDDEKLKNNPLNENQNQEKSNSIGFKCSDCEMEFSSRFKLLRHSYSHTGIY